MSRFLFMVLFFCLTACSRMAYDAQLAAMERLENDFRAFDLIEERKKNAAMQDPQDVPVTESLSYSKVTMEGLALIVSESAQPPQEEPLPQKLEAKKEPIADVPLASSVTNSAPEKLPASPPTCDQVIDEIDRLELSQCAGRIVQLQEVQCIEQAFKVCMNPPGKKAIDDLGEWRCKSKMNERIKKVSGRTGAVTL